jgi:hypothetical protein
LKNKVFSFLIFTHGISVPFSLTITLCTQGGDPLKRNENDKAALEAKIAAKAAKKAAEEANAAAASNGPIPRKKSTTTKKADNNLDDLLSAGLSSNKKRVK